MTKWFKKSDFWIAANLGSVTHNKIRVQNELQQIQKEQP